MIWNWFGSAALRSLIAYSTNQMRTWARALSRPWPRHLYPVFFERVFIGWLHWLRLIELGHVTIFTLGLRQLVKTRSNTWLIIDCKTGRSNVLLMLLLSNKPRASCDIELLPWQIVAIHTGKIHIVQSGKHEDSARRTKSNWKPTVLRRAVSASVSIDP